MRPENSICINKGLPLYEYTISTQKNLVHTPQSTSLCFILILSFYLHLGHPWFSKHNCVWVSHLSHRSHLIPLDYQNKWLKHLERITENQLLKLLYEYTEGTRDVWQNNRTISFLTFIIGTDQEREKDCNICYIKFTHCRSVTDKCNIT